MSKKKKESIPVHHPKTESDFKKLNRELNRRGYVAIDVLKPGKVRDVTLAVSDTANVDAQDMAVGMGCGTWSNGPLAKVAWSFDSRDNAVQSVPGADGKPMGLGYVKWGSGNNIPSVIPPLAMSSPYTAAPLRYIADLTAGLGPRLMYRLGTVTKDNKVYTEYINFEDAGLLLKKIVRDMEVGRKAANPLEGFEDSITKVLGAEGAIDTGSTLPDTLDEAREALKSWENTWYGIDIKDENDDTTHIPGAKEFMDENNLNLHIAQCEQDDVMLDMYFPTIGLQRGRRGPWDPKIVQVDMLPAHSVRLEKMNEYRHINHVYFSDQWRTLGQGNNRTVDAESQKIVMYPAAMPQHTLSDLRYIIESNQRTRIKDRPTGIVCPTFYPSGQKPYYPQPAWWSVFTSKAFDFAATILYDKYKARENSTSWGKIIYISLDYLNMIFADEGMAGNKDAQDKYIDELDNNVENFLQQRENNGKMMRQFKWEGKDGKPHYNVEIVDVAQTKTDSVKAGKEELELSTSPIFLALQVDPRLVGVPMVAASNGGTALREMHLLKQLQLNPKQQLYLHFLNIVPKFNKWDSHAEFIIKQQTLTTLDNSKTGTKDTIAGGEA